MKSMINSGLFQRLLGIKRKKTKVEMKQVQKGRDSAAKSY